MRWVSVGFEEERDEIGVGSEDERVELLELGCLER